MTKPTDMLTVPTLQTIYKQADLARQQHNMNICENSGRPFKKPGTTIISELYLVPFMVAYDSTLASHVSGTTELTAS